MTRPLRQRHRIIVVALAVILPILFALGILGRKPIPTNPPIQLSIDGR